MPSRAFPPLALVAACLVMTVHPPARADDPPEGEAIYRQRCASCHGPNGEGNPDEYAKPLVGDRSPAQLAQLIARTMPADDPGTCTGEEADRVAAYIHEAFYSPMAQARNRPPRIELSRLTVRQYRNAVADLIGSFREGGQWSDERGLRAEYYKGRRFRGSDRVIERIDPVVRFDFGTGSPDPEKFEEPHQFSIRWEGSVLAPETGRYEFIVRTEHAARLWVNDPRKPLIDAWVKSGNDTEYRESIDLLGGRAYPIRLEFSKAKQGVDDSKNQKEPPPSAPASIALLWAPPGQVAGVIPARNLSTGRPPELFVLSTPFPPDDRSIGYERGTSVSKEWEAATTEAAIETAGYVVAHLRELSGVPDDAGDRADRLKSFAKTFAERAFRRPLTDEQTQLYIDRQFAEAGNPDAALKRVLLLVLKSPRFLYREPGASHDAHDVAARLSFALWDSLPDRTLRDAAANGQLATREQLADHARRMLPDLRARSKLREFFLQWLRVDLPPDLSKDPERFAGFDRAAAADLRSSLDLFLERIVWGEPSDFRQLFLADAIDLNGRLAALYGAELPPDADFQPVSQPERAGLLTHPYLLATFAYTATSSPIHRGVFLSRSILGKTLRPPPEAVAPLAPDLHPDLTTRQRVTVQTSPQACLSCHAMINPLGFTLENFDAIGRYRKEENGQPIDASGAYATRDGSTATFQNARELAAFLADCEEVHDAFVEQLFHYVVKQPIRAFGPTTLSDLRQGFLRDNLNIRNLLVQIAATAARPPAGPPQ
jgi:cytochrome c5